MMMSLAKTVRFLRPWAIKLVFLVWIAYRCSPSQSDLSLLRLLLHQLQQTRDNILALLTDTRYEAICGLAITWLWRVVEDCMAFILWAGLYRALYCLYHYSNNEWKDLTMHNIFAWAHANLSFVSNELDKQAQSFNDKLETVLHKSPNRTLTLRLPKQGRAHDTIVQELARHAVEEDKRWQSGTVSGTVYGSDPAHSELMTAVFGLYTWSNPLHPGYWPKLNQCEAEVISMTAALLHAPNSYGCMTSGGTESIILAIRAHVNYYGTRRGIAHPELVCGTTAHAAVLKACEMFQVRVVMVDCDNGMYQLSPATVRQHITCNTVMIFASAPCYPQGVLDPIAKLGQVAQEYDIGLHVDACLGGFVLPFLDDIPVFDFRVPGVTSMSADTHKYGFASKGTSVVLYRHKQLRHAQYFSYAHWTGGVYSTPTIAGSRPGALSACAWASLVALGHDGYRARAAAIFNASRNIAAGIRDMKGLQLMTPHPYMVVCFGGSHDLDIYRVQDHMTAAGWSLVSLQSPASVHIAVTMNVVPRVDAFLLDLRAAVAKTRQEGPLQKQGTAAIYGTVGSLPAGPIEHTLNAFTDMTLSP